MSSTVTHVGFSDESNWNTGRYGSVALVTMPLEARQPLEGGLGHVLKECGLGEFSWERFGGVRERGAAEGMCHLAIDKACCRLLRVDALIWDKVDRRHNVRGRDDIANLERMCYHLFRNVLRLRWPRNAVWRMYVDRHAGVDWDRLARCLEAASERGEMDRSWQGRGWDSIRVSREYRLEEIVVSSSRECPLVQFADLFAGMAAFSWNQGDAYQAWLRAASKQSRGFRHGEKAPALTRRSVERFRLLQHFVGCCEQRGVGVSLGGAAGGLWTRYPSNPINFWLYEPQCPQDKAPTRLLA